MNNTQNTNEKLPASDLLGPCSCGALPYPIPELDSVCWWCGESKVFGISSTNQSQSKNECEELNNDSENQKTDSSRWKWFCLPMRKREYLFYQWLLERPHEIERQAKMQFPDTPPEELPERIQWLKNLISRLCEAGQDQLKAPQDGPVIDPQTCEGKWRGHLVRHPLEYYSFDAVNIGRGAQ